jgi:hypothetical protein
VVVVDTELSNILPERDALGLLIYQRLFRYRFVCLCKSGTSDAGLRVGFRYIAPLSVGRVMDAIDGSLRDSLRV